MKSTFVHAAKPTNLDEAAIGRVADSVVERLQLRPGDDMDKLAARLGGVVVNHTDPQDITIRVVSISEFYIFVGEYTGYFNRRRCIAKAIGHYFIHYPLVKPASLAVCNSDSGLVHTEANAFANVLLVPTKQLLQIHKSCGYVLTDTADAFSVSTDLIRYRLQQLEGSAT